MVLPFSRRAAIRQHQIHSIDFRSKATLYFECPSGPGTCVLYLSVLCAVVLRLVGCAWRHVACGTTCVSDCENGAVIEIGETKVI